MHRNKEIVWAPILGDRGVLYGLTLDSSFAESCLATPLSDEELRQWHAHLWTLSAPENWHGRYEPSEIFVFYKDTLLIQAIYMRHADSGKWLDAESGRIGNLLDDSGLVYSYHHAGWPDVGPNLWLQYAFSFWAQCAVFHLEEHQG